MDFDLNDEQKATWEMINRFSDEEIAPHAGKNDAEETFPWDTINKMAPLGLLGGPVPKEYGGAGLDYISHAIVTEAVGRGCSSIRTTLSVQISLVELTILKWGTEEQKKRYLPPLCKGEAIGCFGLTESDAGSDPASMKTSAKKVGSDWVLNGSKMWISNGTISSVAIVFAQADADKKHRGITAFLVDTDVEGFSSKKITGKLGLRASDTAELHFEDVKVPDTARLGEVGAGFKVAMSALDSGRYSVAAGCVGICQGSLDASIKYSLEREQFGKPIASFQLVQEMIARMVVDTDAARLLTYRAGDMKNKGLANTQETSIAKYYASEAAMRCSDDAIQVHGGYGYSNEYPVERYMRDARVAKLYEGTSQIQKLIIAGNVLGVKAFV